MLSFTQIHENKYAVLVDLKIKGTFKTQFKEEMLRNAKGSVEQEEGCLVFDVCSSDDGLTYFLYEIYTSPDAFDAHLKTSHFQHFDAVTRDWIEWKDVRKLSLLPTETEIGL